MKTKRLLLASLLLAALSASASARQKAVEHRQGDAFSGPVREARIEHATFGKVDGVLVEGPRRLSSVSSYTPDGKRKEQESYAPGGALRSRDVRVYDDSGREVEVSIFDGAGNLQMRVAYRRDAGERLIYKGDGSLRERWVSLPHPDGTPAETRIYEGDGALRERTVIEREGGVTVQRTYGADGVLKKSAEDGLGEGGVRRRVDRTYAADGSVYGRRVADVSAARGTLEIDVVNDRFHPGAHRTRETREYDPRRNLSRLTTYVLNEATGEYEPSDVSYYTLTYYR
jgi:hypothetical protein